MKKIYKDKPCPECRNFTNRGVSIDAVIIRDKKILLIRRGVEPFKDYWGTPGGYVGWDETVEDTVRREVKEETNLDVEDMKFVGVYSSPKRHPKQVINLVYLVDAKEGEVKVSDDAVLAEWFSLEKIPADLAFDHRQNVKDALKLLNK
jgi:8-oxo-dGTP diphosphatase